jgi:hypothetical protein
MTLNRGEIHPLMLLALIIIKALINIEVLLTYLLVH